MLTKLGLAQELAARHETHGDIIVGLAGAGQMGTDMVVQCAHMTGVRIGAISESRPERALAACRMAGLGDDDVVEVKAGQSADAAIEAGKIAISDDFEMLCNAGRIDVLIDATGNPNIGARLSLSAMSAGKHVVMLNVEADITIGRYMKQAAKKAGVVYTGAAGDEPACTLELIGFAQSLGLEIVAAGKGKNNPLRFDAVPEDYQEEAARRNMNARMLVEFVDGSKTMIEMVAIANATGLVPDCPGMHGPAAGRDELAQVLCTEEDGGILSAPGRVDYTIGKGVAPGVFCVVKPKHPRLAERMTDLKVGPGPCYALFRPYHLTSMEVPLSAIRAVTTGRPDMEPVDQPVAECTTVAKRDLAPGEILGRIGQRDYRGWAMTWEGAKQAKGLPLGLVEKAKVLKPIKAGELITSDNAAPDESLMITQIRRELDAQDEKVYA